MGIATGSQALASGMMLLVTGLLMDHDPNSLSVKWKHFFVMVTCFAAVAWFLSWISIYFDRCDGRQRLRNKQSQRLNSVLTEYVDCPESRETDPLISTTTERRISISTSIVPSNLSGCVVKVEERT